MVIDLITLRPDALARYGRVASDLADDLSTSAGALRVALDDLRATGRWADWIPDVPPLDIDLAVHSDHLGTVSAAVQRIASEASRMDEDTVARTASTLDALASRATRLPSRLLRDGDRWIVTTGPGDDHVRVVAGPDGTWSVLVGARFGEHGIHPSGHHQLTADQARNLVIRTGSGNDVVEVPTGARLRFTLWTGGGQDLVGGPLDRGVPLLGGGGDDRIFLGDGDDVALGGAGDDEIHGGTGIDSLHGQGGDDRIVGGDGIDVVYGGRGDDVLLGGGGRDVLEGGSGNDVASGSADGDVLSGGRGDDRLAGGAGDDVLLAGRGSDTLGGGTGTDRATLGEKDVGAGNETTITIALDGSPGEHAIVTARPDWMTQSEYDMWLERIDSDLELIRATPSGREGLQALDEAVPDSDSGWNPFDDDAFVVVMPYGDPGRGAAAYRAVDWMRSENTSTGHRTLQGSFSAPPGHDYTTGGNVAVRYDIWAPIGINPQPPPSVLHHEFAHSYDQMSGGARGEEYTETLVDHTGKVVASNPEVPMAEINSVGHDFDGDGEIDTQPSAAGRDHPSALTENALLDDLDWPRRKSYAFRNEHVDRHDGTVDFDGISPAPE